MCLFLVCHGLPGDYQRAPVKHTLFYPFAALNARSQIGADAEIAMMSDQRHIMERHVHGMKHILLIHDHSD